MPVSFQFSCIKFGFLLFLVCVLKQEIDTEQPVLLIYIR